ncbi:MAG: ABC transporter permease [Oscillospiraceae bacterium]|nr:ABC transporter permease [Oscillospiraceae bacterium]
MAKITWSAQPSFRANPVAAKIKTFFKFCKKNPSFTIGLVVILIIAFVAIFAELIAPNDPTLNNPKISLMKPFTDLRYPLGTDYIGRCLLSRMIFGIRTSMVICVSAVVIAVLLGVIVGIFSGMSYPGKVDSILMRIVDVQMGYPFIVLVIIFVSLLGQSIPALIVVLALSFWAPYARNIRGSTMIEKNMDYISAARLMGAGNGRIAGRYLGRNVLPGILPVVPMDLSSAIIIESLLAFMGLGVQPPMISLGNVMGDGKNYISTHWWITAMPGILIVIIAIALTLIGDALHKQFDPKLKD